MRGWERCSSEGVAAIIADNNTLTQVDRDWLHRTLLEDVAFAQFQSQDYFHSINNQPPAFASEDNNEVEPLRLTSQKSFSIDNLGRKTGAVACPRGALPPRARCVLSV